MKSKIQQFRNYNQSVIVKTTFLFSVMLLSIFLMSFTGRRDPNSVKATAAGIYGVCSSETLPFKFELSLNADHTFHYVNTSVPGKAIDATGTWEQNGNTVTLSNYTSEFPINKTWKIDRNNDNCLKSRKGMEFTRLCNLQQCQ
jgi:hypothetical protein